jgi:hypothetical protein
MSKTNRAPIDYTPQYSDGIFRPKEVVEEEVAQEAGETSQQQPQKKVRPRASRPIIKSAQRPESAVIDDLYRSLQQKQRLASSTFRFQPDELAELDAVASEVSQAAAGKISKNDVVRLALNRLLSDYRENNEQSTLRKVVKRT